MTSSLSSCTLLLKQVFLMMTWRMNCTTESQPSCKSWLWLKSTPMDPSDSLPLSAPRLWAALKLWATESRRTDSTLVPRDAWVLLPPWLPALLLRRNLEPCHQPTLSEWMTDPSWCGKVNASTAMSEAICLLTAPRSRSLTWRNLNDWLNRTWPPRMIWKTSSLETSLPFGWKRRCWHGGDRSQQTAGWIRFSCW